MVDEFNTEHQFILDAVVEGIYGIDAEGTITFCNDALLRMTGYSKEEVVGKKCGRLAAPQPSGWDSVSREECDLRKAILGGKPREVVGGPLWKKDGTYIPVEYCGRPTQRFGNRTCYVATIRDLSEIELAS